jgi:outer membrane protein assembly factor BamA
MHQRPPALLITLLLMVSTTGAMAATQNVVDLVFDGLPAEITPETAAGVLVLKTGVPYNKALLPADRDRLTVLLENQGFLDNDTKTTVNFIPSGVRLTFTVKARNRYHIEAVEVDGLSDGAITEILAEAKVAKDALCTQDTIARLAQVIAPRLDINVLFIEVALKPNSNKKAVTLVFAK